MPASSSEQSVSHHNMSSPKPRPRSNDKVSFSSMPDRVYQFRKVADADACVIWYHQEDYHKMRKHTDQSLQKLQAGKLVESSQECLVGLARMSQQGLNTKRQRHQDASRAVFREQHRQLQMGGVMDASSIAEVYGDCCKSSNCQTEAVMMALGMEAGVKRDAAADQTSSKSSLPKSAPLLRAFLDRTGLRRNASFSSASRR